MSKRIWKLVMFFFFGAMLLTSQGCDDDRVSVPPSSQDKAPTVTFHALASGGSGQIEEPEITYCPNPCDSYVTVGTDLIITADAVNQGGVKQFTLSVKLGANTIYTVAVNGSYDANNKVPKHLGILGTNGAGGIGGNPLLINIADMSTEVTVTGTATNFNNMTNTITAVYKPLGHVTASLSASSTTINPGEQVILNYDTKYAHYPTQITNFGTAALSGYVSVNPTVTTKYTLIAQNFIDNHCTLPECKGAEKVSKSLTIKVRQPSLPPQPETMRINLQAQPMGPQGGYQPYAYTFAGTVILQQIELPTNSGNSWVAGIKLPKLGNSTESCGDPNKNVLLTPGSRTTPQQMKDIFGSETPMISTNNSIFACISPKQGAEIGSSVGIIITYTH